MIKTMFAFGALVLVIAAPAAAQTAAPAAAPAMAPPAAAPMAQLPKCSATVRDQCDQSATSERYALTADQAMKTGGVGDRKSDQAAMGAKAPMTHKMMKHHHMTRHHTMTKTPAMMTPDATTEPKPN